MQLLTIRGRRFSEDFLSDGKVTQLLTGEILLDQSAVRAAKIFDAVISILAYVYFPVGIRSPYQCAAG